MDAIEIAGTEAIEVIAEFDGAIIDVRHLVPRAPGAARRVRAWALAGAGALAIAAATCVAVAAGARLGHGADVAVAVALPLGLWALARAAAGRDHDAHSRDYVIGAVAGVDCTVAAEALRAPRQALVRARSDGAGWELVPSDGPAQPLAAGARASVRFGAATFHVAQVAAPRSQAAPPRPDWARDRYTAAVAAAVALLVLLANALPVEPQALVLDLVHADRDLRLRLIPPVPPPSPAVAGAHDSGSGAPAVAATIGARGQAGNPHGPRRRATSVATAAPARADVLRQAGQAAQGAGILRLIAGANVGAAFRSDERALGEAESALSGIHGDAFNDGYGSGGADVVGRGPGGGGDSDRTIGVGPLTTVGSCPGCRGGHNGYPPSAQLRAMRHTPRAPEVTPGDAYVRCGGARESNCLDKEIIRRVVRQHRNEVRYCYERALLAQPELSGRVVAQFVIADSGRVLSSTVRETTVADPTVGACIAAAVRRWEFPASRQTSMISYPFVLTAPAGSSQ